MVRLVLLRLGPSSRGQALPVGVRRGLASLRHDVLRLVEVSRV